MFSNKKIIIFVIIALLILVSARYLSFAKIKYWVNGLTGKVSDSSSQHQDAEESLDFETSDRPVCQIEGTVFIKAKDWTMQKTKDAVFRYRNIDSPNRVIYWEVSPKDNVKGGPNMFTQLPLPNGEDFPVQFYFEEEPKYKKYTAKAIMTYGEWKDGKVISGKRNCEGEIKIIIDENW